MPVQMPADTFMQRWFATAKKARAIFPGIKLVGPVPANEWQWYNWNGNWISYGGKNYVWLEFFIKRIADEQKATGIRLLDVLDIHFYPGESAAADIVQLHRVWFDRNYVYPGHNGVHRIGGWDTSINKEYVFGRCQDWLNKYIGTDHGVTFSVTETDISSTDPNVRAIWYASTLGEFARQGVEIFTPWGWAPGMYEVVHLFSRYNQENYIIGTSNDEVNVSAYPTINAGADSMTIILVNRSLSSVKEAQVTVTNFAVADGPVNYFRLNSLPATETFKSHTNNALKTGTVNPAGNVLAISLPPLSVTSLILKNKSLSSGHPDFPSENRGQLKVFPNPAVSDFSVSWPLDLQPPFSVTVMNLTGQVVLNRRAEDREILNGHAEFRNIHWPSGFYIVILQAKESFLTTRFRISN
jgi:hypothetical protein